MYLGLSIAIISLVFYIYNKIDHISNLEQSLTQSQVKVENLEKNQEISNLVNGLNLRLGKNLNNNLKANQSTFGQLEKDFNANFDAVNKSSDASLANLPTTTQTKVAHSAKKEAAGITLHAKEAERSVRHDLNYRRSQVVIDAIWKSYEVAK